MKKLVIALTIVTAMALTTIAEDTKKETSKETKKHHELTADQKALVEKYDTNKDGKLDKDERAKMSAEDKAKWEKAAGHKKEEKKDATK